MNNLQVLPLGTSPGIMNRRWRLLFGPLIVGAVTLLSTGVHALIVARTTANLDIYNAFNGSSVLTQSDAFATWQRPQSILLARFAKVSMQVDF